MTPLSETNRSNNPENPLNTIGNGFKLAARVLETEDVVERTRLQAQLNEQMDDISAALKMFANLPRLPTVGEEVPSRTQKMKNCANSCFASFSRIYSQYRPVVIVSAIILTTAVIAKLMQK